MNIVMKQNTLFKVLLILILRINLRKKLMAEVKIDVKDILD